MKKVIYIEGTRDMDNGDLRKAFSLLFEKELKGNMPKVIMGNGKDQTIDKFHSTPLSQNEQRYLLVDSDAPVKDKVEICTKFNETKPNRIADCKIDNTFLMIQESESWILSQPDVLQKHNISVEKLPQRNVVEIPKPSEMLAVLYKVSNKEYHKVRDFSHLLPDLDTNRLKKYFDEFNGLVAALK